MLVRAGSNWQPVWNSESSGIREAAVRMPRRLRLAHRDAAPVVLSVRTVFGRISPGPSRICAIVLEAERARRLPAGVTLCWTTD